MLVNVLCEPPTQFQLKKIKTDSKQIYKISEAKWKLKQDWGRINRIADAASLVDYSEKINF